MYIIKTSEISTKEQALQEGKVLKQRTKAQKKIFSSVVERGGWEKIESFEALKLKFPNLDFQKESKAIDQIIESYGGDTLEFINWVAYDDAYNGATYEEKILSHYNDCGKLPSEGI